MHITEWIKRACHKYQSYVEWRKSIAGIKSFYEQSSAYIRVAGNACGYFTDWTMYWGKGMVVEHLHRPSIKRGLWKNGRERSKVDLPELESVVFESTTVCRWYSLLKFSTSSCMAYPLPTFQTYTSSDTLMRSLCSWAPQTRYDSRSPSRIQH